MNDSGRLRHHGMSTAGPLLGLAAALDVGLLAYTLTVGADMNRGHEGEQVFWITVSLLLLLFVARGSRPAWGALLVLDFLGLAVSIAVVVTGVASEQLPLYAMGLLAFAAGQLGILLSSRIRSHVSRPASIPPGVAGP